MKSLLYKFFDYAEDHPLTVIFGLIFAFMVGVTLILSSVLIV